MGAPVVPTSVLQQPSTGRKVLQAVQRAGVAFGWKALQVRQRTGRLLRPLLRFWCETNKDRAGFIGRVLIFCSTGLRWLPVLRHSEHFVGHRLSASSICRASSTQEKQAQLEGCYCSCCSSSTSNSSSSPSSRQAGAWQARQGAYHDPCCRHVSGICEAYHVAQ
jgi:hypothetical protein